MVHMSCAELFLSVAHVTQMLSYFLEQSAVLRKAASAIYLQVSVSSHTKDHSAQCVGLLPTSLQVLQTALKVYSHGFWAPLCSGSVGEIFLNQHHYHHSPLYPRRAMSSGMCTRTGETKEGDSCTGHWELSARPSVQRRDSRQGRVPVSQGTTVSEKILRN